MASTASERTELLLICAWHEGAGPAGLRARVTSIVDLNGAPTPAVPLYGTDAILACVRLWLQELSARS